MILAICVPILERYFINTSTELQKFKMYKSQYKEANDTQNSQSNNMENCLPKRQVVTGSCCNAILAILARTQIKVAYMGAVGDDKNGKLLWRILNSKKLEVRLERKQNLITNVHDVFIKEREWSNILQHKADIILSKEYIKRNKKIIERSKIIYISIFTIYNDAECVKYILHKIKDRVLIMNLASNYILSLVGYANLKKVVDRCDIIIGNFCEMDTLRCKMYFKQYETVKEMIVEESKKEKVFITTNSEKDIQCAYDGNFASILIKNPKVLDYIPVGIGDLFAAGYISAYYEGLSLVKCILKGCEWVEEEIKNF